MAVAVVDDGELLVVANEGTVGEVGQTTSPVDGALGRALGTTDPGAELDLHGGLGVGGAALGVVVGQDADGLVVDEPGQGRVGPLDGVLVELALGVADGREPTAVVGAVITLAEVVGLDLGGVAAEPLPVDLVEVVGLQDEASNNASSDGRTAPDVDLSEEEVLLAGDGGGVALLLDGEDGAVVAVGQGGAVSEREVLAGALGEVDLDVLGEGLVIGAL